MLGFDKIGLQQQSSSGPSVDGQIFANVGDSNFTIGLFGLGSKPTYFSNFQNGYSSFMKQLKDEGRIPTLSYGYTAGAKYRK